jgi:hypothetical protein
MSVVSPPSSNTNVGNAGAGGSTSQLSALAWATSNISINNIQSTRLHPVIASGTQRPFSWFHGKSFRVIRLIYNGWQSGRGFAIVSYPISESVTPSPTANYSFRYDTWAYVTFTAVAVYGFTFSHWAFGTESAPTSSPISFANPVSIYTSDWTSTDYFRIWAVFS